MRSLAKVKQGSLGFSFVVILRDGEDVTLNSNLGEVEAAAHLAREIGCDYFEVKPVYDMGHHLVALSEPTIKMLEQQLRAIRLLSSPDFEVIAPVTLDEVLSGRVQQPKDYDYCHATELRTLLTSSGAYVCPYHRGNPLARYGDPTHEPFAQLWSQAQEAALRISPSRDCKFHCIRHETKPTGTRDA